MTSATTKQPKMTDSPKTGSLLKLGKNERGAIMYYSVTLPLNDSFDFVVHKNLSAIGDIESNGIRFAINMIPHGIVSENITYGTVHRPHAREYEFRLQAQLIEGRDAISDEIVGEAEVLAAAIHEFLQTNARYKLKR